MTSFLSTDPPRRWLLLTARGFFLGLWILLLAVELPDVLARVRTILATMPAGPDRLAALEDAFADAVPMLVVSRS